MSCTSRLRKQQLVDFVIKYKVNCFDAFQSGVHHKDFKTIAGKALIKLVRQEIPFSNKTWDGDIYCSIWHTYKQTYKI
jgi:hypothetical protein